MYIAPGQRLTSPWTRNFYVNRNTLSLWSFIASFKNMKSDFIQFFFHDFIHVYSPGVGADSPKWTKFWCQQKLVTSFICCKFQKNVFKVWFYTIFFMIQYMYIASGQGQTAPRGQNFDVNRNFLSLHIFVASFKEISLSLSNFVQLFSWFNTCIQHRGRGH